jgi:23S rRNA pseudouridine2605 synthase
MFDAIGHSVVKLRRVAIGLITDQGLKVGAYRKLSKSEIEKLVLRNKEKGISEK